MPLWKIYHTGGTLATPEARQALAKSITTFYTSSTGMPAFYVGVVFLGCPPDTLFIGGEARPFVRLEVDQIHIRHPEGDDAAYKRNLQGVCEMLKPHLQGVSWEIHIDQTDRRLWAIDGIAPPKWRSEEERRWREAGRPLERL